MDKLAKLRAQDQSLWAKLKEAITELVNKIRELYASLKPDSKEGQYVAQMKDAIEKIQELFTDALIDASENYQAANGQKNTAQQDGSKNGGGLTYSFRDSKSGMANDSLLPYGEELTDLIQQRGDYIVDNFAALTDVVDLAFSDTNKKATAYFGIIDTETLNNIQNNIPNLPNAADGILFRDSQSYSIAVTMDSIRHLVDEKGLSKKDVIDYLDRFADTIIDFDSVSFGYYERGNSKTSGLLFKKAFDDGVLISFDLVSHKKRRILLQSLYMDNADYQKKKSSKTLLMQNAHSNTPKAQVGKTSKKTVAQPSENVKKFSFREYSDVEKSEHANAALKHFGRTYSWKETGYLTQDGKKIDFSGKHEGGPGGYRTVDHRDIRDAIGEDYGGEDYSGAMVQFMREGNIRISPESNGINLSVDPTKAQINALDDYISRVRGEVMLDIDDLNGNTVSSTEYPRGTRASKVLADIRNYFENGETPYVSEVSQFRYSTRDPELQKANAVLEKENSQLREDVQELKALLKLQRQVTNGARFTKSSVEAAARYLKSAVNTSSFLNSLQVPNRPGEC